MLPATCPVFLLKPRSGDSFPAEPSSFQCGQGLPPFQDSVGLLLPVSPSTVSLLPAPLLCARGPGRLPQLERWVPSLQWGRRYGLDPSAQLPSLVETPWGDCACSWEGSGGSGEGGAHGQALGADLILLPAPWGPSLGRPRVTPAFLGLWAVQRLMAPPRPEEAPWPRAALSPFPGPSWAGVPGTSRDLNQALLVLEEAVGQLRRWWVRGNHTPSLLEFSFICLHIPTQMCTLI